MTPDAFRDAITKGLGRVVAHLRNHPAEPYLDIIEHACTHNLVYDTQIEGLRTDYLLEIMRLSGHMDRLAAGVLEALRTSTDDRDTYQAYELAGRLAAMGYHDACSAMYERFERCPGDVYEAASSIIALDGEQGLLTMVRGLGRRIVDGESVPVRGELLSTAEYDLGENVRERLLVPAARDDATVRAFLDAIDHANQRDQSEARQRTADLRLTGLPYGQLRERLEAAQGKLALGHLTQWGRKAPRSELTAAARDALTETRPAFLLSYLRLFFGCPFPLEPDGIIRIADEGDDTLAHAALIALKAVESPQVRAFGIELLHRRHRLADAFALFRLNYDPGDHRLFMDVLSGLESDTGIQVLQGIGFDLNGVYEERLDPECRVPLLWVYENTPCAHCRERAVGTLLKARQLPEEVRLECLDDCNPRTRELARNGLAV